MAKLGTAFVDIQPDFSAFDRLVARKLSSSFKGEGEKAGRDFSTGFDKHTSGLLVPLERELGGFGDHVRVAIPPPTIDLPTKIPAPSIGTPNVPTAALPDLSRSARIDLKLAGAEADVERLKARIAELTAKPQTVEIKGKIGDLARALDVAEARVKKFSAQRAEINVDVDRSGLSRVTDTVRELFGTLGGSGGGGLGGAVTRVSAGFFSFGSSLGPIVALLGGLAVTIGVSLVGALAALVASLAAAAAGAAALGIALGAVLAPVAVLGAVVGVRLGKIFAALKAQDAAANDVGQKTAAGSQTAAAALAQQQSAATALTEANRQLGLATTSAYREMQDAATRAADAVRGVADAQASLADAKLTVRENENELAKFRGELGATGQTFASVFSKFTDVAVDTSGLKKAITAAAAAGGTSVSGDDELKLERLIQNVRDAKLREKDAIAGVTQAHTTESRAQQDNNKFKRQGIQASEGLRAAERNLASAKLAVAAADTKQTGLVSSQAKALTLTNQLSKSEQRFLAVLTKVRTELTGAFAPATDAVIGGLTRALGRAPALINPLCGAFKGLGEAAGQSLDRLSGDLIKPKTIASFRLFTNTAARLAGPITDGLLALFHIFLNIANAALPHLVSGTRSVATQLKKWDVGTSNSKQLSKTIGTLVGHLNTWLGVGAAIADVFLAFLESAAAPGQNLAESIKAVAERTATWLRSTDGREQLKQFFKDAIAFTKDFVTFMARLVTFTVKFGQEGARVFSKVSDLLGGSKNLADALIISLGTLAALKFTKGLISGIQGVVGGLRAAGRAASLLHERLIARADASTGLLATARATVSNIAASLASAGRSVLTAGRRIAARLIPIFATEGALAGTAGGNAAVGAQGLAATGIKGAAAAAGRSVGRAFGLGVVAGVTAGLVGLADQINKKITQLLVGKSGVRGLQNFANDRNANPLSQALKKLTDGITGLFGHHAAGVIVPGTGNRDTYPALLTPGEAVTRKAIVKQFGPTVFADINAGRLDPRVGYQAGRPRTLTVRPAPGPRMATGGIVGRAALIGGGPTVHATFPITVPGGGPPDPVALGVQASRVLENRFGGDVRQD